MARQGPRPPHAPDALRERATPLTSHDMPKDLAIVLNSGSINSSVVTALAGQKHRVILLHAEIAPQPGSRIRAAYDQQVAFFKPYREHTLPMPFLAAVQP